MSIDPHNLGPTVYKYEQVITLKDLDNITEYLMETVNDTVINSAEADRLRVTLRLLEILYTWVKTGKKDDLSLGGG